MSLVLHATDYPVWSSGFNVYRQGDPVTPICTTLTTYMADDIATKLNREHFSHAAICAWTPSIEMGTLVALPLEDDNG